MFSNKLVIASSCCNFIYNDNLFHNSKHVSSKNWPKLRVVCLSILHPVILQPNDFTVMNRAFPVAKRGFPCIKMGVAPQRRGLLKSPCLRWLAPPLHLVAINTERITGELLVNLTKAYNWQYNPKYSLIYLLQKAFAAAVSCDFILYLPFLIVL